MIVAIDGPAGSGKSAAARRVAERLGFLHLDTGALYRAFTLRALRRGADLDGGLALAALVDPAAVRMEPAPGGARVWLDGDEVTQPIRAPEVTRAVQHLAREPAVRERITALTRSLAEGRSIVTEGRDTTTVIFPEADVKLYVDASAEERARRRLRDFAQRGHAAEFAEVLADIERRDRSDRERSDGPLTLAPDAIRIDTSDLDLGQVVDRLVAEVERAKARAERRPAPVTDTEGA